MITNHMTNKQVAEVMQVPAERITPIVWAVLQAQARGATPEVLAESLGVGVADLEALRDQVCDSTGDEAKAIWEQGLLAIRVGDMLNQEASASGWDAAEAMALNKLNQSLAAMQGAGSPELMLQIAATANKALRRQRGESNNRGYSVANRGVGEPGPNGVSVTLKSGDLGMIRLRLSPALQGQLQDGSRTIDVTPSHPAGGKLALEMLKLSETRALVADENESKDVAKSALDNRFDFTGLMTMDIEVTPGE